MRTNFQLNNGKNLGGGSPQIKKTPHPLRQEGSGGGSKNYD
jgi:hypothetical protein